MADTVKCALFVDYDSIYRRLAGANPEAAGRLAQKVGAWVGGIETGSLVAPAAEGVRRRILIRRCYASPEKLGAGRASFVASGFEVVDCPIQDGRDRNSADIHIVLDTIDALEHPAGYEEFILLSADADLTPVLLRLRAHARTTVIYANEATAATYRAIADGMIEEAAIAALVTRDETAPPPVAAPASAEAAASPAGAQASAAAPPVAGDRNQIEALARKVHAATNVPLFSPRTYADLFRHIAQEIAERGYHFQHTAENVTEKLVGAGRNVNRRQVLFVVKGLALKGHVFSVTDTPERLAEVFREQVVYLIGNSELKLDETESALLPSWIVGRVTATQAAAEPPAKAPPPKRKPPVKPVASTTPVAPPAPAPAAPAPAPVRAAPLRPSTPAAEAPAKAATPPPPRRETPAPAPKPAPPPPAPVEAEAEEAPKPARKLDEIRAAAAARLAAIGRQANAPKAAPARPSAPARPAAEAPKPAEPAKPVAPSRAKAPSAEENKDALESSILAAIAQAVDVLVEDSSAPAPRREAEEEAPAPAEAPASAAEAPAAPEPEAEPVPSEGGDSDDIGDEIQRIIASYSRARNQSDQR